MCLAAPPSGIYNNCCVGGGRGVQENEQVKQGVSPDRASAVWIDPGNEDILLDASGFVALTKRDACVNGWVKARWLIKSRMFEAL